MVMSLSAEVEKLLARVRAVESQVTTQDTKTTATELIAISDELSKYNDDLRTTNELISMCRNDISNIILAAKEHGMINCNTKNVNVWSDITADEDLLDSVENTMLTMKCFPRDVTTTEKENAWTTVGKSGRISRSGSSAGSSAAKTFEKAPQKATSNGMATNSINQSEEVPTAFSVKYKDTKNGERWYSINIPAKLYKTHPESELYVPLFTVDNEYQLSQLPAGMMVYNIGDKIPKVCITTGTSNVPSVPLGCRMYSVDDSDTTTKYSLLNLSARSFHGPADENFYINKKLSKITKIPEDSSRNFRMPTRGKTIGWSGYGVYRTPNFGDMKYLESQINATSIDDAVDLYQFSIHMALVSMIHHMRNTYL